jgi:hypothetical protein
MKPYYIFTNAITIGLASAIILFAKLNTIAQIQPDEPAIDPDIAEMLSTNPPPQGFTTRLDYVRSFVNEKDIGNAYRIGLITKGEAMVATRALADRTSLDFYGKVIDQSGQPVAGVKVQGYYGDNEAHKDTKTDERGLFHFLELHGNGLGIRLQKEGYEYGYKIPYQRPSDYLSDPIHPVAITMYKLRGGEPMKHIQIYSDLPCDGGVKRFDLLSHAQRNTGDLMITLTRNPLVLNPRDGYKPFNWLVSLAITNGGLQETTNLMYPNEAPINGYQPSLTLNFPTNMMGWQYELKRTYFFKAQNGQTYGRMTLHLDASRPEPPTYFDAEIYANPGGSRNLEFDPSKEILR